MKRILLFATCYLLPATCYAVCPVCTVAVAAGLEGARLLGVSDVITGVWAGGLTLLLFFWTVKFMKKRNVLGAPWYILAFAMWYGLLASMYLLPSMKYGANTLWGIDKFMLGAISGTVMLYIAERWNHKLIRGNGGKSLFKFQKVVIPFGSLLLLSAVFACIVYL